MAIKLPPYDLEIEKIVLGSLIANSNSLNEVRTIINEDCFYDLFHKDVFNAIKILDDAGTAPNMMTVYNELLKKYAELHGPLTIDTANDSCLRSWQWMEQPFPWEQEGGCR